MYNKKLMAVSLAVLLSLMISLIFPVGVLADDGQPPVPEVTNPSEETSEEGAAADSEVPGLLDTEEPNLEEGTDATDSNAPDAAPDQTSAEAESPEAEEPLLSQLPEGTEVVVLDEEGQVLPLGSQEADTAIISGDPMWCPDGVDPVAGVGGCTSGYTSMTALLATLAGANQPTQNGTIWIEKTYNSSTAEPGGTTNILIDGNVFTNWRNHSLTINGGWDGAGTNTTSGTSLFFDDRFRIINWWDNVTVNNIVVDGVSGNPSLEIEIDTVGINTYNVTLENVEVKNNVNNIGAFIDNDESTGSVTVNNSRFINNGNDDDGLQILAMGNVSLLNVTATNNGDEGVQIDNTASSASATVQVLGTNTFTGNSGDGLNIRSDGNITLNNITANANLDDGADISNSSSGTNATVTITGTNSFSNNTSDGLVVVSRGAIMLSNVTANNNVNESGVVLDNDETGAVGGVIINGSNTFNGNDNNGLNIASRGSVNLNNITADGNKTATGVAINNCSMSGGVCLGSGDVTLTGSLIFTNNGNNDDGLNIYTGGNVSLADVIATGNKSDGVEINNTPSTGSATVQIGGTNVFTGNAGTGLLIYSDGNVGLNNVTSSANTGSGVYIENLTSSTNATVTLTGSNSFVGNTSNGLYVRSRGAITLSNITATGSVADSGVWLDNDETGAAGGVTINGTNNVFSGNNDSGLGITSRGAVSLENITANGNKTEDGVSIDNSAGTGVVTLIGILTFTNNGNDNSDDGLYLRTRGNLTLANVTATGNKDEGVDIDNTSGTGSVTITGGTFNQNNGDGLNIRSDGLITLVDVTANQNGDDGGDISNDTSGSVAGANVFVVRSTFNSNGDDGLVASSNLDITLINVTAQNNDNDGVELFSDGDNVVLCGGVFSGNDIQVGSTDYNVRVTGGTRTRSSDIVVTNWTPTTGWTTVANGTGRCNYPDADTDLLPNTWDADDDNDGVLDGVDACPIGAAVGTDTDGDGCKDTTEDTDNDNDGVLNAGNSCPVGASVGTDTDGDGCKDTTEDTDNDNDGVLNAGDTCPLGAAVGTDTDGDGCKDTTEDSDNDNDGLLNAGDACPVGAATGTDTDGDGCKDAGEDNDDDGDSVLDASELMSDWSGLRHGYRWRWLQGHRGRRRR